MGGLVWFDKAIQACQGPISFIAYERGLVIFEYSHVFRSGGSLMCIIPGTFFKYHISYIPIAVVSRTSKTLRVSTTATIAQIPAVSSKEGAVIGVVLSTIHWKALEEHFLMVQLVFRFNHFRGENAFS
jgi:hypothetical protein